MVMLVSCATLREWLPGKAAQEVEPDAPVEAVVVPVAEPEAEIEPVPEPEPEPLAAGDVRITIVAGAIDAPLAITADGEEVGVIEAGGTLQWDRPGGVTELAAEPISRDEDRVRFIGLFLPGEETVSLEPRDDGSLAFLGAKTIRLSAARKVSRLRRRAQRLPLETAVAYLKKRHFAAPAPGRLHSAYADGDQEIVADGKGPILTWCRFDARGKYGAKAATGRSRARRKAMKHAFADFVDADIRPGVTARVAFRRNPRDIEPARTIFRLGGEAAVGSNLESLLVALIVCCPGK